MSLGLMGGGPRSQFSSGRPIQRGQIRLRGRVLVVDDSSDGRWMISQILRCLGLEVDVAPGGQVAIQNALFASRGGNPFDLILMDLEMPDMDGRETTAKLRSCGYRGLIVAMTSCTDQRNRGKCLDAGCDDVAHKPISFAMLRDVTRRHLPLDQPSRLAGVA